ncbi:MAG: protein kinase [Magnetococcales bacterium]|nr:protein kinase [Magnetococcales bacterium]MBF0150060.1 protein kinase [Magnetococcales bacterium]
MHKGDVGDRLYVLMDGQVKVFISDDDGKVQSTLLLGAGEVVGEMAVLMDEKRSADVMAYSPVSALAIGKQHMDRLLHQYPSLAGFLTRILVKRIQSVDGFRYIGKYKLLDLMGMGSTARVYDGIHQQLERHVVIKMLNHALVYEDTFRERFKEEARIIAKLQHPNIIQVYDTEHAHGTFFIIMEKLQGKDLRKHLKAASRFSSEEVVSIVCQVARALEYAHREGILHRDIKLANCFMTDNGQVKLMDFGLSRPTGVMETKSVEGSPDYLAPEVILGHPPDERSDIYSLGVMAFALLTGTLPFSAESVRSVLINQIQMPVPDLSALVPDVPQAWSELIQGTLAKDPNQRLSHWPTIFSLLDRLGMRTSKPSKKRVNEEYSVVLTCPAGAQSILQEALRQLTTTIEGLIWEERHAEDD